MSGRHHHRSSRSSRRTSRARRASQDSAASSLRQVDPMPIADAPPPPPTSSRARHRSGTDKNLPPLPRGTAGVGLHGHSAIFYLSRIQRYSSYAFGIFSSVHLATASLVPLATRSVAASESYLLLAREIYQTRLSEPLLVVLPLVAHVAAGVGLRLVRRQQNVQRYGNGAAAATATAVFSSGGWPAFSLTSASGYALTVALAAHVALNRVVPLAVAGDSSDVGLAYVAHGFARHPATATAAYVALLGLAAGHTVWGAARWLNIAQTASWNSPPTVLDKAVRRRRRRTWLALQGGVLLVFAAWAAGGLGVVARGGAMPGWLGRVYDGLYKAVWL